MKTGVYTITNLINGKMIVGSGILNARKSYHYCLLKQNKHDNPYLQNAVNEHGIENFVFEILEECEHYLCTDIEGYWVNMLGTTNRKLGYNLVFPGKAPMLGRKMPREAVEKMRQLNIGRKLSKETKFNMSNSQRGRKHSESTKLKMSLSGKALNKKISQENKILLSKLNSRPIVQFDLNNSVIKEWNSLTEASQSLNIAMSTISYSCKNGTIHDKKFKWKYKDEI